MPNTGDLSDRSGVRFIQTYPLPILAPLMTVLGALTPSSPDTPVTVICASKTLLAYFKFLSLKEQDNYENIINKEFLYSSIIRARNLFEIESKSYVFHLKIFSP